MKPRRNQQKIADLIALIYKAPRTAPELADLTGISRTNVVGWLAALLGEGLVEKDGLRKTAAGGWSRVYKWSKE